MVNYQKIIIRNIEELKVVINTLTKDQLLMIEKISLILIESLQGKDVYFGVVMGVVLQKANISLRN